MLLLPRVNQQQQMLIHGRRAAAPAKEWLRSDLTQRLRSHLTQHAGMGSEAKVIELAGGKSGHLKLLGPLYTATMSIVAAVDERRAWDVEGVDMRASRF